MLRNRKTGETFDVISNRSLTTLNSQSVFKQPTDYSQVDEFVRYMASILPNTLVKSDKEKILTKLRQEYKQKINEISKIVKLITELNEQMKRKAKQESSSTSIMAFLTLLGTSLVKAKLDSVFPGLAFFASLVVPAATDAVYTYVQGPPTGGEDLCEDEIKNCIQGHLTELGKEWNSTLPQVARIFEPKDINATDTCGTHQDLQAMMRRAYRGPNEFATNCTISEIADNGGDITVKATNVDPITCDIMKDSLVGLAGRCRATPVPTPPTPTPTMDRGLKIGLGVGIGGVSLGLLSFALYKCVQHNRQQSGLLAGNQRGYHSISTA
jgi:hypothetical protein